MRPHTGIILIIGMGLGILIHGWSTHEAATRLNSAVAEVPAHDALKGDGQATMDAAFAAARWRARGGWSSYLASPDAQYDIHLGWGECAPDQPDVSGCVDPTTDPHMIYLDQSWFVDHQDNPDVAVSAALDTASHELAHLIVYDRCGTTAPPIIPEGRVEHVTDTIAILYLGGAPRLEDGPTPDSYSPDGYGMGPGDEDTARAIWEGQCEPH